MEIQNPRCVAEQGWVGSVKEKMLERGGEGGQGAVEKVVGGVREFVVLGVG